MATISNLSIDQYTDFSTSVTVNAGTATTILNGALTDSATTITVNSTTPFPNNGTIIIGTEYITYTGTTTTTFTGCTRAASDTTAVAHSDNAAVSLITGAMNLTGYSALAQIRKSYDSTTSTAFTTAITSATDGILQLSLTDVQTAALTAGRYQWDLVLTDAAADKMRVVEGIATIRPGVSRS